MVDLVSDVYFLTRLIYKKPLNIFHLKVNFSFHSILGELNIEADPPAPQQPIPEVGKIKH